MTDVREAPAPAEHAFDPADAETLVDPRLRELVERYARLAGGTVQELEPQLVELSLPDAEIPHFRGRRSVRVAFSLGALERHPDAEMAVVGGAFLQELLDAVRTRGFRQTFGLVPPTHSADTNGLQLTIPVRRGSAEPPALSIALHPAARLVARVAIKAAAIVEEHIAESGLIDLATGLRAPDDLAGLCLDVEWGRVLPAGEDAAAGLSPLPTRPLAELVPLMVGDLEARLATQLARHRNDAEQALAAELARIDRYYRQLLEEAESAGEPVSPEERRAIEAEHCRRRAEEERRHEVRATVHPLQLVEFKVLVQRADWALVTQGGRRATLTAQRTLSGSGAWQLACPTCGAAATEFLICRHDHVACVACAKTCTVCGDEFCGGHGSAACHVDGEPACDAHAAPCTSCRRPHCTAHTGTCGAGDHPACTVCLAPCGVCGKVVCAAHSVQSDSSAPKGNRRLCRDCMVYCEGGTNEPVGRDEAVRCASCEKFVCVHHQAPCVVDHLVHCSTHLRRADRSRRLVCEQHRAQCAYEPALFASDELTVCPACGKSVCDTHAETCVADKQRYCQTHLAPLHDTLGDWACESHRTVCHVDDRTYSIAGTWSCPVCERPTCAEHLRRCKWCGRAVCERDIDRSSGRCATCRHLAEITDPSDALIAAAVRANKHGPKARRWTAGRDATHTIVELDLGWTRRLVVAVRLGDGRPESIVRHAAFRRPIAVTPMARRVSGAIHPRAT